MNGNEAVAALGALAQESRLSVFRLLVREGPDGLPAGEIAQSLKIPQATLSFHLKELVHARLALSRRQGRSILYAADYAGMRRLMSYLTENCCAASGCEPAPPSRRKER